jgi:ribosomal protein S18 acetylase RimI-like enzyme
MQTNIKKQNELKIDNLTFRHFQGEADYPVMYDVMKKSKDADKMNVWEELDDLIRNLNYLNNCDPYKDFIFAEVDGQVIAYSTLEWWAEVDSDVHIYSICFYMLPEWRQKGLGAHLLEMSENRAKEIAVEHPEEKKKYLEAYAVDTALGSIALFEGADYQPIRYFYTMSRPLNEPIPELDLPEGLNVRLVQPDEYRKIWDGINEAFRDHWGFREPTENDYQSWLKWPNFSPEIWQVAWDGDEVAGMVMNFVNESENERYHRKRGYTECIFVRKPWRHQGIARTLISRSLRTLKTLGMEEAALGVDTHNLTGALSLYEGLGYQPVKRETVYRKDILTIN